MKTGFLDNSRHDRNRFDCGVDSLNNYLRLMANQQSGRDNTRTYVLEEDQDPRHIIGFYTLAMISINLTSLPHKLQKRHQNANAGGLAARLAVDRRHTGRGYGKWLLVDALRKLLSASEKVGFPFVIVDAKEGVAQFYKKFGFQPFHDRPDKLFITVSMVRSSFKY